MDVRQGRKANVKTLGRAGRVKQCLRERERNCWGGILQIRKNKNKYCEDPGIWTEKKFKKNVAFALH